MKRSPDIKLQVKVACDVVLPRFADKSVNSMDARLIVEELINELKDRDEKWSQFDEAPRNHYNTIFSHMY